MRGFRFRGLARRCIFVADSVAKSSHSCLDWSKSFFPLGNETSCTFPFTPLTGKRVVFHSLAGDQGMPF